MHHKYTLFIILAIALSSSLHAQSGTHFALTKEESHFFFTAELCGSQEKIMLESGLPAFLVGQDFYEQYLKKSDLAFEQSKANIRLRLFNSLYRILFQANGPISVGEAVYDGPIFILEDFEGLSMPVQYLKDAKTGKAIVMINLPEGYFTVGKDVDDTEWEWGHYPLYYNQMNMPTIKAKLNIHTTKGEACLKGDFIVDFGNPMLLFLMRQHKSIVKAIRKGHIELQNGYDNDGHLVSQGIYADKVSLCGRKYHDISIGITDKMQSIEQLGLLGLPFYEVPVVLDFDNKIMKIAVPKENGNSNQN